MDILQFIDNRNHHIWLEVKKNYDVSITPHKYQHHYLTLSGDKAQIHVPEFNPSIELFTHELLHLWLRTKNIFITDYLLRQHRLEPLLSWSLTENLFETIGHCLEHAKILPLYLQAGFEKQKFADTYHQNECTNMQLQILQNGMSKTSKTIPLPCLDLYISRFFTMKASANDQIDCQPYFQFLRNLNPHLFHLLQTFWQQWSAFDITQYDVDTYSYKPFTSRFVHSLGRWSVAHIHAGYSQQNSN